MGKSEGWWKMDSEIEEDLAKHCEKYEISPLEAIQLFPVLARRTWLKRFLAHHEIFLKTLDVPGDIVELGVFRGQGLMTWANFLECYCVSDRTKTVYGFDNWEGFTSLTDKDGNIMEDIDKCKNGYSPKEWYDELKDAIKIFDKDRFVPWKERVKLVKGNIQETVPEFIEKNPGVRFSLVNFDCDIYEPTKVALEYFWPKLSRGGVFIFDEYAKLEWSGETQAVDEFFADKNVRIKKFSWNNVPAGYVIKE